MFHHQVMQRKLDQQKCMSCYAFVSKLDQAKCKSSYEMFTRPGKAHVKLYNVSRLDQEKYMIVRLINIRRLEQENCVIVTLCNVSRLDQEKCMSNYVMLVGWVKKRACQVMK